MPKLLSIKPVIKTIMSNKNDSFSFENDPGKLEDKDDTDFTFADIPVLGNDKKKDAFSLDQISDENQDNPSLASFENLLSEAPQADGNGDETQDEENSDKFDASASTIDVQRVINARDIKKKKKIILILGLVGGFVALIIVGTMIVLPIISPPEKDKDEMTPEEKAAFEAKQKQEEIAGMLASSDSLLEAKEYDRSLASYKNVLRIDRKRSLAHTGCGKSYEKLLNIPDAKSSYQKAIDTVSGIPDPYHLLASILIKEGEIEKSLILLERGKKKFADNPQILYLLGDSYYDSGDTEKSLENYRKVPKDALNKESLIKFGSILREESKQEANELYHFGGKKFKDFNLFLEAAKSTDQSKDKVVILTEAVQVLSDNEEKIDEVKYLLAKALSEDGNNAKALETLSNINISELDKEYCCQLVNLATKSGMSDVKNYCLKILASNPNEIPLQQSIQSELISALPREKILDIYGDWLTPRSNEAVPNYLYGMALGESLSAKKYFEKSIMLKPSFYEAIMELAKINIQSKNLSSAEKNLKKAILMRKNDKEPNRLLAIVKIRKGKESDAMREYSIFLANQGVSDSKKALDLFELSLLLPTSSSADNYLNKIKSFPS